MLRFATGKLLLFVGVYLLASGAIFMAMSSLEDPVMLKFEKHPDPQQIEAERARLGLDRPLYQQFWRFHVKFLSGDWERSLNTGRLATEDLAQFFPATLELTLLAVALGVAVGVSLALYSRTSHKRAIKTFALSLGSLGLIVPIFWLGLVALLVGGVWLGWFPLGGRFDLAATPPPSVTGFYTIDSILAGNWGALGEALGHLVLPASCLAVYPAANVSAVLYARLNEPAVNALYVSLQARGFSRGRIVFGHLLRVGAGPVVTVVGTTFGALIGGAFLTESVFSWPGLGRYVVNAIVERDLFVAQYLLLLLIVMVFAIAFLSDIVAKWLDPLQAEKGGAEP